MNKISILKWGIIFAVFSTLVLGVDPASACSSLGSEKHMGVVKFVDPGKGTMSLIDAETQKVLTFVSKKDLLKKVHMNDTIVVTFEKKDTQLIAKAIVVHRSARGML
ncbi:MAG: hypothetical protein ACE5F7_01400 [Nitrospiria bacterium]